MERQTQALLAAVLAMVAIQAVRQQRAMRRAEVLAQEAQDRYYRFTAATSGLNA